jgi:hypothetical protein
MTRKKTENHTLKQGWAKYDTRKTRVANNLDNPEVSSKGGGGASENSKAIWDMNLTGVNMNCYTYQ